MIYVVGFNSDRRMIVNYYSGSFCHNEDARFFRRLAEKAGASSLIMLGESVDLRASKQRISSLGDSALCVPFVWFKGDVDPEVELHCPFVNDNIYKEYLAPVQQMPGTSVPKEYLDYVGVVQNTGMEPDADVVATNMEHPILILKDDVFSTFPGQFPPLMIEDIIFGMHKGMPCLYPLDWNAAVKDSGYFMKAGYSRFLTMTSIAEQSGFPFYKYDSNRSVVFYLPLLEETSPGVFIDTERGRTGDPFGIGVDTVTGAIVL